jgi:hypothetical protein
MTYREIAVVIAFAIPAVGWLIEFARTRSRLHDFREIGKELRSLVVALEGTIDRDDDDLLVRGSYGHWPVLVRFSRSEYEAGVSIEMPVPTNVTLYCYPVSHEGEEGQVPLRTSDERFMSRFRLSSDNSPLEVSMILSSPAVLAELSKILDSQTFLILEKRMLELVEATIVPQQLAARLINCVRGMTRIASQASEGHGMASIPPPPKREPNRFRIAYLSASALILVVLMAGPMLSHVRRPGSTPQPPPATTPTPVVASIPPELARQIPQLQGWHVAEPKDFDQDANSWLQQVGQKSSGKIAASLGSEGSLDSVAFVLERPPGPHVGETSRFVLFVNNEKRFDSEMPQIDAAIKIGKSGIGAMEWRGRPPVTAPNGDGIVIIQRYNDSGSAIVFFMGGPKLLTAVPKDFHTISFE